MKYYTYQSLLSIFLFLQYGLLISQELPPVLNFGPNQYSAGNQNWMISQDEEDNFFFANGAGLLEYDGERFHLYPVPNNSIVRSVKYFSGRIYTGAYMEAGYWMRNEQGTLKYKSIVDKFPNGIQDGELFWDVKVLEDLVIFRSFSGIYFYNPEYDRITQLNLPERKPVSGIFKLEDKLYFQLVGGALYEIKKGNSEEVIPQRVLGNITIKHIYGTSSSLKLVTGHSGFFKWNNEQLVEFNTDLSREIGYTNIFAAVALPDEGMILGTVGKGILQINNLGEVVHNYNQENILLNNTILSLFIDKAGKIWAGLDYGISMINPQSAITSFRDVNGEIGSVYASYVENEDLYLGTNQGLYLKKVGEKNFSLIPGTNGQVWSINKIDDLLFCGHDTGTFLIEDKKATKICERLGTWFIKKLNNNTYVQGHYYGFSFIEKIGGELIVKPLVKDFPHSSRYIEIESDSTMWVNNEHKGVFRVKFDIEGNNIEKLENFQFPDSIWATSSMFQFADTLYYSTKKNIYQFDRKSREFTSSNRINDLIVHLDKISGKMINDEEEKLWGFAENRIFHLRPSVISGDYELEFYYIDQNNRNIAEGYENITRINEDEYIVGVANGYLRLRDVHRDRQYYPIRINRVEYSELDQNSSRAALNSNLILEAHQNNISFDFSSPVYHKFSRTLYKYRLMGLSRKWSNWDPSSNVSFKNLPYGTYEFQVKALIENQETAIKTYNFKINPPYYLSNLALGAYFLIFLLFLIIVHFMYRRHHKRIILRNERQLRMAHLEAEQEIIKLRNEKLEQDMATKNRELAVSTMSLIKKNEFLSSIKEKLKSPENIGTVVQTIDKDINEEDNWKFFKKAFSNADKNFLKKIKSMHPELTSSDLKLCAYLRLNLTSKEIAPLLNISVKSVEIKRYRLRKKMNLDRNVNLTDYILSI